MKGQYYVVIDKERPIDKFIVYREERYYHDVYSFRHKLKFFSSTVDCSWDVNIVPYYHASLVNKLFLILYKDVIQ